MVLCEIPLPQSLNCFWNLHRQGESAVISLRFYWVFILAYILCVKYRFGLHVRPVLDGWEVLDFETGMLRIYIYIYFIYIWCIAVYVCYRIFQDEDCCNRECTIYVAMVFMDIDTTRWHVEKGVWKACTPRVLRWVVRRAIDLCIWNYFVGTSIILWLNQWYICDWTSFGDAYLVELWFLTEWSSFRIDLRSQWADLRCFEMIGVWSWAVHLYRNLFRRVMNSVWWIALGIIQGWYQRDGFWCHWNTYFAVWTGVGALEMSLVCLQHLEYRFMEGWRRFDEHWHWQCVNVNLWNLCVFWLVDHHLATPK